MAKPSASPYACSECGWTGAKWYGRCPECQVWGSIVERGRPESIRAFDLFEIGAHYQIFCRFYRGGSGFGLAFGVTTI